MESKIYIGIIFFIIGILMTVYNQTIGIYFSKIGKQIWTKNKNLSFFSSAEISSIYNEEKAPSMIKILGVVNIFQGLILILLGVL